MDASTLRLTPCHSSLLRPKHFDLAPPTFAGTHTTTTTSKNKNRLTIAATLSKPTAEISSTAVTSRENPLQVTTSAPPPPPRMKVSPESLQYPPGFLGAVPERTVTEGGGEDILEAMGYLTNILSSKVYDVAIESPLQFATKLSERLGVKVWLKREDLQPVFSFKLRGAYNMMAKLEKEQLDRGVICSSAGNHAQGVALAAKKLGCDAVIAMPVTTPEIKWQSVKKLGATVVLVGDAYDEAQSYAKKRAIEEGRTFIPPFDHPDVIMGQGTVGMEIMRQLKGPLKAIFVPVGGGGLIAGIAAYVKRVAPEVKIIGVEPSDANAMALSLHHGQRVILDKVGGFADGVAVKEVGEETFRLCKELVDGVVLVSRDAICASIKDMFEEKRSILEPAGALALAGAEAYCKYYGLEGDSVVAITSGANMNFDKLRVVTELANVGRQQEAVLTTVMPEEPGSFKRFCELVGPLNITEFKYRCNSDKEAIVLYSVGVHKVSELEEFQKRMESSQLKTFNLTKSDLVKDHLRYLMGGRSTVQNEILCRFIFPERPGALMKFLDAFSPRWNISLFHYRGQGETGANVLVGVQIASSEMDEFHDRANNLGYDYVVVTNDNNFQLLMH
ncbi:threonine dehydratase biosynthetic, chloroplastic isoform X1 [Quercus suber]|uniref:Threonine dehydratase n=1 Tax=Quercus suber TaxID=58331 RepID=A0AAW0KK90_QUESU|nr:threonine dehydratase biosynthetic, chloroplastic [Quercus suber]POE70039.1 threonine dehydratase biosynthetic, chloroplastic [Quercus suber]